MQIMIIDQVAPASVGGLPAYDVIIPCFNRVDTIERVLCSILAQAPSPSRVVLVDDGSTDATASLLLMLEEQHSNVHIVLLPRNAGASAARNAGLALARAEWVAFVDSDDVWLPHAASSLLAGSADSDVVVGHFQRVWRSGIIDAPECGWDGVDILSALALTGVVGPSWSLMRREVAMRIGGFDPSYHNCNDWDFYVRAAAAGARFKRIDDVIAYYHIAASNRLSLDEASGRANAARVKAHPMFRERGHDHPIERELALQGRFALSISAP